MADASALLPYATEYAKSGRSSCRGCKGSIEKAELRLAVMVQSRHHDGRDAQWYHFDCFFEKQRPKSVGDIAKFDSLRWDDQQKLGKAVEAAVTGGGVSKKKGKGKGSVSATECNYDDYKLEYAKSSRSACFACEDKIAKMEVRISKLDYNSEKVIAMGRGPVPRYHHIDCFLRVKEELGFSGEVSKIPGFKMLDKKDQLTLSTKFKDYKPLQGKRKLEDGNEDLTPSKLPRQGGAKGTPSSTITSPAENESKDEAKMKRQNEAMFKIRDFLSKKHAEGVFKKSHFVELLQFNGQAVEGGVETLLDRLTDVMTFGRLEPCKLCKGHLEFRSGIGYQCQGYLSEFTKCMTVVPNPSRLPFQIPEDLKDKLGAYKFKKPSNRCIPASRLLSARPVSVGFAKIKHPLRGLTFVVSKSLPKTRRPEILESVKSFKGEVVKTLEPAVTALISSKAEFKKGSTLIEKARVHDVPVLSAEFISEITEKADVIELMKENLISDWTPADSIPSRVKAAQQEYKAPEEKKRKPVLEKREENVRLQMKDGNVVDPECEIADFTHVYKNGKLTYSVVLKRTDVDENKNTFYKLQLLENDSGGLFHVFRSWGRIGTVIGGHLLDEDLSLNEALDIFNKHYQEKTGGNVFGKKFVMKPGHYMLLDISYDAPPENVVAVSSQSKLPKSVQELVCLIFDVKRMMQTLVEFDLDTKKMPLGKISKDQLLKGFQTLNDLMKALEEEKRNERRIVDFTNKFFSLIPHNFGVGPLPVLDDRKMVHSKVEMLEQLMDIELAYEMTQTGIDKKGIPVDDHYKKLHSMIDPVEKNSTDYKMIQNYLENTHGHTHSQYKLNILQVYKVKVAKDTEGKRLATFEKIKNHYLLWHGSRTTNYAGILSQGLRIAPPEAPVTGYMFGKGIYFADMVSKSANYCHTTPGQRTGLLLLCEVALGEMKRLTRAKDTLLKPPKGYNSVLGVGGTTPDPKVFTKLENDVLVPYGPPVSSNVRSELLYNEYIVYDVGQVQIRYIVKVDFDYGQ